MLVWIALLLALVPAAAILYPFLRRPGAGEPSLDESSLQADLERRWDAALVGLKNTELERALGNLTEEDYLWLRRQYMLEAAVVMRAMELEEEQERELASNIEREVREVRLRMLGQDGVNPSPSDAPDSSTNQRDKSESATATPPLSSAESSAPPRPRPPGETAGE